jgi:hypothetical protein
MSISFVKGTSLKNIPLPKIYIFRLWICCSLVPLPFRQTDAPLLRKTDEPSLPCFVAREQILLYNFFGKNPSPYQFFEGRFKLDGKWAWMHKVNVKPVQHGELISMCTGLLSVQPYDSRWALVYWFPSSRVADFKCSLLIFSISRF